MHAARLWAAGDEGGGLLCLAKRWAALRGPWVVAAAGWGQQSVLARGQMHAAGRGRRSTEQSTSPRSCTLGAPWRRWDDFKPLLQALPSAPTLPTLRLPPFRAPILDTEVRPTDLTHGLATHTAHQQARCPVGSAPTHPTPATTGPTYPPPPQLPLSCSAPARLRLAFPPAVVLLGARPPHRVPASVLTVPLLPCPPPPAAALPGARLRARARGARLAARGAAAHLLPARGAAAAGIRRARVRRARPARAAAAAAGAQLRQAAGRLPLALRSCCDAWRQCEASQGVRRGPGWVPQHSHL